MNMRTKKNEQKKSLVRWSRKRGSITEWVLLIVVAVAFGVPLAQYVFKTLRDSGHGAADKISGAQTETK
jgi:hypothetical protein